MQRNEIKPEEVWAFWRHMQGRYKTSVVNKSDAVEMQLVAKALDLIGVMNHDRFLANYTTTLGSRIYTAFEVGVPRAGWDLWHQVATCAHEHQHVIQSRREPATYEFSYAADRAARARYEAEAYRCDLELHFWRYGTTPSPGALAAKLYDYGCRKEDVAVTEKALALSAISVRQGAIINETSKAAIDWLEAHVPHLRAKGAV